MTKVVVDHPGVGQIYQIQRCRRHRNVNRRGSQLVPVEGLQALTGHTLDATNSDYRSPVGGSTFSKYSMSLKTAKSDHQRQEMKDYSCPPCQGLQAPEAGLPEDDGQPGDGQQQPQGHRLQGGHEAQATHED